MVNKTSFVFDCALLANDIKKKQPEKKLFKTHSIVNFD